MNTIIANKLCQQIVKYSLSNTFSFVNSWLMPEELKERNHLAKHFLSIVIKCYRFQIFTDLIAMILWDVPEE